jgi:hypothetical protein
MPPSGIRTNVKVPREEGHLVISNSTRQGIWLPNIQSPRYRKPLEGFSNRISKPQHIFSFVLFKYPLRNSSKRRFALLFLCFFYCSPPGKYIAFLFVPYDEDASKTENQKFYILLAIQYICPERMELLLQWFAGDE